VTTAVKEKPILFSSEMVRALLDGRKTQTRRKFKNQDVPTVVGRDASGELSNSVPTRMPEWAVERSIEDCPYGRPGDRLWVKETWRPVIAHHCAMDACDCADVHVSYAADNSGKYYSETRIPGSWLLPKAAKRGNVSPLLMPRWASRITLEITDVRVQRLQDISEEDAKAEGAEPVMYDTGGFEPWGASCPEVPCYVEGFAGIWSHINGPDSWSANPWVWAISFKRI
jgi:hypothetical protein